MYLEDDLPTQLTAEGIGNGDAGGTLAGQLTNEAPPVIMQTLGGGAPSAPAPVATSTSSAPAAAPVIINSTQVGNKTALGMTPTFIDRVKDSLGAAQTAVSTPIRSGFTKAAKAAGASDDTANTLSLWVLPVVVVLAIAGTVYAFRHRIFSHKITA